MGYCKNFTDDSFGKGKNVFIVENAKEYPKIKDVFKESFAGYIQQLLKGKIKKACNEPLIVIINGSRDEFPSLKNSESQHVIAKIQF